MAEATQTQTVKDTPVPARPGRPLRMYRCRNRRCLEKGQMFDFCAADAGKPVCPKCGWGTDHPRLPLLRLVVIHYDPPLDEMNMEGKNVWACNPKQPVQVQVNATGDPVGFHAASGSPLAVNCPLCKQTQEYQQAMALLEE